MYVERISVERLIDATSDDKSIQDEEKLVSKFQPTSIYIQINKRKREKERKTREKNPYTIKNLKCHK